MRTKFQGFTLIELMIVVAIIAIIAAIALPNYNNYVLRTQRADAQRVMVVVAAELERLRVINNGRYPKDDNLPASISSAAAEINTSRFKLTITTTDQSFTLEAAVPTGSPQTKDSACQTMTLNHLGRQTPAPCW